MSFKTSLTKWSGSGPLACFQAQAAFGAAFSYLTGGVYLTGLAILMGAGDVALPYRTVNLLYMIISLPQILLLGLWGRVSDRLGHQFALKTSGWLFSGETLFMAFAAPQTWRFFIPVAFLISSAANAGVVVAVFNRRYELMPKENRIAYDNFYTAVIGFGFILGPMIGGAVKGLAGVRPCGRKRPALCWHQGALSHLHSRNFITAGPLLLAAKGKRS